MRFNDLYLEINEVSLFLEESQGSKKNLAG